MKSIVMCLVCVCAISGCTVTFAVIGAIRDHNTPDSDTLSTSQIKLMKPGDSVFVAKKDGSMQAGKFVIVEIVSAETYALAYSTYLSQNPAVVLPYIGDTVTVVVESGRRTIFFTFKGFDCDAVWVGRSDSSVFPFHGAVEFKGQTFSPKSIPRDTPLLSRLIMSSDSIPMDSVRHIIVTNPDRSHHAVTGILIGAAVDALIIAGLRPKGLKSD